MKKYIIIFILTICVGPNLYAQNNKSLEVVSSFNADSLKISDLYMQAIKDISIGNIQDGYSILTKIMEIEPDHAPTLAKLSRFIKDGKTASDMLSRAVELDTTNIDYKYLLVERLFSTRDSAKAIKVGKDILEKDHKNIAAHLYMISVYGMANQPFAAMHVADSALVIFGNREEILAAKQDLLHSSRLYNLAAENGEKLISIFPENINYIISTAEAYSYDNNDSLATKYYNMASDLDSISIPLLFSKYQFHRNRNQAKEYFNILNTIFAHRNISLEKKLEIFEQQIDNENIYNAHYYNISMLIATLRTLHSDRREVNEIYATHLIRAGELDQALDVYKNMLKDSTATKKDLTTTIELIAYINKNLDSAQQYIDIALDRYKTDLDVGLLIASLYIRDERYSESLKITKQLLKHNTSDSTRSEILGFIGDTYYYQGNINKCYKSYDQALEYNPDNISVLNNYSYFLSEENKDLEKALRMAQKIMRIEPNNATFIDTYAWILYKLGEYEQAKNLLRRAIALDDTNNPELLLHLGDVFFALNDKLSAESYWKRALNAGAEEQEIEERKTW